ncbi:MAG: Asp-tRNA(Asn)/Glu-tRNA(Gln) amidotransferase subunit GatA [Oscillospiraceae bacterium]|nr:Asp-tRNA(Asn)/Glu-tRNA(Gln) amidotransferase subunit GatA [Oscillospiraceae bacterium]
MFDMSALELSYAVKAKKLSVVELVTAYVAEIEREDGKINAFISVSEDTALKRAEEIQKKIDSGDPLSPLAGVPIAVKDNINVAGMNTTCASEKLKGYISSSNATVIDKLEENGLILLGKLNMDEFAMGLSCDTGIFGPTLNPWDITRSPGGSSGGSAAAVAAGEAPLSLGSDTGGSIRRPCAFCGVTGIKPTYGSVSRYGLIPCAPSLDQIGPLGRDINDCAALLSVISGPDPADGTCVIEKPFIFDCTPVERLYGFTIGLPRNRSTAVIDPDVGFSVSSAVKKLETAGAVFEDFDMPLSDRMMHAYYIIACAEASVELSLYDDPEFLCEISRPGNPVLSKNREFGPEVKKRIMFGSHVLSPAYKEIYHKNALLVRELVKDAYNRLFERFDMILSPVTPTSANKIGESVIASQNMFAGDIFTVSANLAGLPAVSLPCGFDRYGIPVGLQLTGDAFSENKLIKAARVWQVITDYHTKRPPKR